MKTKIEKLQDVFKFMDALETVVSFLSSINAEEDNKRKQLSNIDIRLQDLLHETELVSLSRREKINLFNAITRERHDRRKLKNILELLEPCYRLAQSSDFKTIMKLRELHKKLKNVRDVQINRTYTAKSDLKTLKVSQEKFHFEFND